MVGADVRQRVSVDEGTGTARPCIVLVPDLVDGDAFAASWIPQMKVEQIIPRNSTFQEGNKSAGYRTSRVKFIYFSWIVETIAMDKMPPLRPHCLGYLESLG